jgi:hypothetical protein
MPQIVNYPQAWAKATAVAADDTANAIGINTGLDFVGAAQVQIVRSGKVLSSDPTVTLNSDASALNAGYVKVADGSSYAVTTGDIITVIATSQPL